MLWIILLALSATVDSWAVGMTYKAQKIKIPLAAKGMISLVSGMTALIAVLFGRLLSEILPIAAIQASGGTLLAVMGVKALWQIKKEKEKTNYDLDLSQKIETWEALDGDGAVRGFLFGGNRTGTIWKSGLCFSCSGDRSYRGISYFGTTNSVLENI